VWGASHKVDGCRQHFGRCLPVFSFFAEPGNHSWLVMIAPEYCVPGIVFLHSCLPGEKNVLQPSEVVGYQHPLLIPGEVHLQVMEAEYHRQLSAVRSCVQETVFHGGAGHFSYCDDIRILSEGIFIQFPEKLMNPGAVCIESPAVSLEIILKLSLADEIHHVKPEA